MEENKEELSIMNSLFKKTWHAVKDTIAKITWVPQNLYLAAAATTLLVSTVFWAVLGARLHLHNADQLVDPYLFTSADTFQSAAFPSAHTFLIKWPIFWLLGLVGIHGASLVIATVAVTVLTVGVLAWVLYKINRRPLVLGTLYFALALILLLIPAQPYAGGILPVNMAMLTTRNLEYVLYLVALVFLVRARNFRSLSFWTGSILLGLLVASDKLFVGLALGGAGLALVGYALFANWRMVTFAVRWLVAGLIATVGATILLLLIQKLHITHLVGGAAVSPYAVGADAKNIALALGYTLLGLLTNFGANAAYDNRTLASLPHDMLTRLGTLEGILHAFAFVLLCAGLVATWYVVRPLFRKTTESAPAGEPDHAVKLSVALVWSTIAAIGTFIVTQHYYAVDARYLTIGLFAVFVAAATALRPYVPTHPTRVMVLGAALFAVLLVALPVAHRVSEGQNAAFDEISRRNASIVQMLRRHKVDTLVGDYWRVLPIKLAAQEEFSTMPLSGCTTPNAALTSAAWNLNLATHSFAYLVTLDSEGNLANFPHCTLSQVSQAYGRPNAVQVIAGTLAAPKEALLFYDQGSHPSVVSPLVPAAAPLLPINIDLLAKTNCPQPTIMNFVAHEDDDLLFLSPDVLHDLHAGNCVRTVYMTAGDSGFGKFYWLSRQLGTQAAYSTMLGVRNVWDQQVLVLPGGQYATVATPRDNGKVSLIFLNLPDGGLHGEGFPDSAHESLAKLQSGAIATLHAIDKQSAYTSDQLVTALMTLMDTYQPAEIRTQANVPSQQYPDHSDHIATGMFADAAAQRYDQQHFGGMVTIPVNHYIGYPVHGFDVNVSEEDLAAKQQAFFAYAQYDKGVCGSIAQCARTPTYDAYLSRQYRQGE